MSTADPMAPSATITIPGHLREWLIAAAGGDLLEAAETIHGGTLGAFPWPGIDTPAPAEEQAEFEAARVQWRAADKLIDQLSLPPAGEDVELDADVARRLVVESVGELRSNLDQMSAASPEEIIHAAEMLRELAALSAVTR
jgi:hypothetical protein